jgi:prolyl 4-hydroxylase
MVDHPVARPEQLSAEPRIECYRNFLTQAECAYLMTLAEPRFRPSQILDPKTGERRPDPVRTSDGMSFGPLDEDMVINAINHRVAMTTGTRYDHGEPLHMLRYSGGQEYRPHGDALPGSGNLRHWTAIMYLNDDYEGGETEFPFVDVKVRARTGDMLVFCNVNSSGHAEPLSRHAGLPVTRGKKYIATRWIHEKRYHPWL